MSAIDARLHCNIAIEYFRRAMFLWGANRAMELLVVLLEWSKNGAALLQVGVARPSRVQRRRRARNVIRTINYAFISSFRLKFRH